MVVTRARATMMLVVQAALRRREGQQNTYPADVPV
jgi:hypothetical protein